MTSPEAATPSRKPRLFTMLALSLWALAGVEPLGAQFGAQYTAPGTPTAARPIPTKAEFQDKLKRAPWHSGQLRLSPWLGLQDVSFVNNLNNLGQALDDDFTLTVGAGLRGYLPAGKKVLLTAHALPEYVWWQDAETKRRLNGRYGLGVFLFLNRMTLELSQRRIEQQGFFSSEIQALTTTGYDTSTFGLDLEITGNLSLFGLATQQERRNKEEETPTFTALDRTENSGAIGLRYENTRGWAFELGLVDRSTDFESGARNLSNSGTSETATISLDRNAFGFRLTLTNNDLTAEEGSDFGTFDDPTGAFDVLWRPHHRLALLGYARRDQTYSVDQRYALIVAERQGARFNFDLENAVLSLFAETGEDDFENAMFGVTDRRDDVVSYGAEMQLDFKGVSFSVRSLRTEYDSNLDAFDRNVTRLSFGLTIDAIRRLTSELVDRLSLGGGDTDW